MSDEVPATPPPPSNSAATAASAATTRDAAGRLANNFGFRPVEPAEKAALVRGVFDRVAARYDLMNDLMSGGVHRLWKEALLDWLAPRPGIAHLDVAGGTGDIALRLLDRVDGQAEVTLVDINPAMLSVGRDRAIDRGRLAEIAWAAGDAERLPFPDRSFDAYTIAFGIRNVTRIEAALAEAYRVLRPGGRFLCLEFSRVVVPGLDRLYDAYSFNVLPALGRVVARDADSYRYLAESIRNFPDQATFTALIAAAGFGQVRHRNLSGGIAAIHSGWRL
jgi:demethylmenaquinone methyltransferase/2-methoxy-6-polyprenyl-1,4-benzoquinol methylase